MVQRSQRLTDKKDRKCMDGRLAGNRGIYHRAAKHCLDENELCSSEPCRWHFEGKSMDSLALWVNMEFMKNAAEIGAGRFLYAAVDAKAYE